MVSALVLAAGASQRLGYPKALLKIGDKTFLQHIIETLHAAQIFDVVVVLGKDAHQIRQTMSWYSGKIALNNNWQDGQISSIIVGLDYIEKENVDGVMICPVDHPFITQGLVEDLLQTFIKQNKRIIIPTFQKKRGHPSVFSCSLLEELRTASFDLGARAVAYNHPSEVFEMPTEERGVIINIDTQQDYEREIIRWQK